jgi:glycosyltransferase involved in cell wall biosynthesis
MGPGIYEISKDLDYLQSQGRCTFKAKRSCDVTSKDLSNCDVLFAIRSRSRLDAELIKIAKRKNKFCILFLDDDFLAIGRDFHKYGKRAWKGRQVALRSALQDCGVLLVVNRLLGEKYSELSGGKRYVVTNTAILHESIVKPIPTENHIKIVYYVNDGSTTYYDKHLRPLLKLLSEKYKKSISIYFIALQADLSEFDGILDYYIVPHMSMTEFREYMVKNHFHIGLAPLDNEGFARYKYFNKFIEFSLHGIAGIYSDCDLYKLVIVHNENGLLCNNDVESWLNAINSYIEDEDSRLKIAKNAQRDLIDTFSIDSVMAELTYNIPELTTYTSSGKATFVDMFFAKTLHYLDRARERIFYVYACISDYGLSKTITIIRERIFK